MPPIDLPWLLWGRPVKPFALSLMCAMFTVTWITFYGDGTVIGSDGWSLAAGVFCGVTGLFLGLAWLMRRQRAEELGLLMGGVAWVFVFTLYGLVTRPTPDRYAFAVWWALSSFGAFLFERKDAVNTMAAAARGDRPRHK